MKFPKISFKSWLGPLFALGVPVYLELALHLMIYGQMSLRIVYPVLFAASAGALLLALCMCLPQKAGAITLCAALGVLTFYFEVQLVYNSIFGEFMSVMQLVTQGAAVTNFFKQMLYGIWNALPFILLLLAPEVLLIVLVCRGKVVLAQWRWRRFLAVLGVCAALHLSSLLIMTAAGKGAYTVYGLYQNQNTGTEVSVQNIGLLSTTRLEFKYMLFPKEPEAAERTEYAPEEEAQLDQETVYNILDLDFDALAASTDDPVLQKLDGYFASLQPSEQNEYTGLLKDYNLITLCAESFSPLLIDEERTPALYKLSTNGFIFENFFGTYGSNTTNGEYTFTMGNYPDMSRSKVAASFFASQSNFLPFCLGNQFRLRGAETWAYHDYTGEYYSRNDTHPNMGYTFQSAGEGLDIEVNWPSSDLEMMEESVDDFLSQAGEKPFHAYYMTFSGHYQYDWENPMSRKNRAMTENLPYSDTVKAYIACNQELEYALQYLMQRLEEAGVADKTVIVLTNDHYPYGLTPEQYNELAGRPIDQTFEKFRNSFLCYVPGMEPVTVDTYCSTVDILPTLLNLFGMPYDSRLLTGRDVLSRQATGMAVLADQSFVTKDYGFNAATGQVVPFTEGYEPDMEEVEKRQKLIQIQFQVSLDVLNHDYYGHAVDPMLLLPEEAEALPDDIVIPEKPEKDERPALPFTDIPEGVSGDCVEFLWRNGYMDPASETKFGYYATGTYAEFADVLYRMEGAPDMSRTWVYIGGDSSYGPKMTGRFVPAVKWCQKNALLHVNNIADFSSYTPLKRVDAAVTLYRYAKHLGLDLTVDEEELARIQQKYPGRTREENLACYWCYSNLIIRGSNGKLTSLLTDNPVVTRYQMARMIYNFYIHVMSGS